MGNDDFYPLPVLLFVLPLHLALLATEAVALLLTGTPWGMVRTIYLLLPSNLLGGLARVIDTRRHIQSRRLIGFADYLRRFRLLPWKLVMLLRYGMPKLT